MQNLLLITLERFSQMSVGGDVTILKIGVIRQNGAAFDNDVLEVAKIADLAIFA